jgi:hypothetical protein
MDATFVHVPVSFTNNETTDLGKATVRNPSPPPSYSKIFLLGNTMINSMHTTATAGSYPQFTCNNILPHTHKSPKCLFLLACQNNTLYDNTVYPVSITRIA